MAVQPIEDMFGSSSAQSVVQLEYVATSKTFKANRKGRLSIFATGGHGSGAAVWANGYATGPGAAECAYKTVDVEAGDEFVVNLGVGGSSVFRSNAATGHISGNPGTDTTIVGPGVNMTVKAGAGGVGSAAVPVAGGLGGRGGTGGDEHFQGGDGGAITAGAAMSVSGAGAVNVKGLPPPQVAGGAINSTAAAASTSGGAGVGGKGSSSTGAVQRTNPGGGGYGGPADDNDGPAGPNALGQRVQSSPANIVYLLATFGFDWFGGGGTNSQGGGPGGGGGGRRDGSTSPSGIFAGPGGAVRVDNAAVSMSNSAGNLGPGGSVGGNVGGGNQVLSGAGAPGIAVFILRA